MCQCCLNHILYVQNTRVDTFSLLNHVDKQVVSSQKLVYRLCRPLAMISDQLENDIGQKYAL